MMSIIRVRPTHKPLLQLPPGGWWSSVGLWFWPQILHPYHRSIQVMMCPSAVGASTNPRFGNYGASRLLIPLDGPDSRSLSAVQQSARTYMFFDAAMYVVQPKDVYAPGGSSSKPSFLPGTGDALNISPPVDYGTYSQDFQSGRHFGGVNVAYADGHVKWTRSDIVFREAQKYTSVSSVCNWNPITSG